MDTVAQPQKPKVLIIEDEPAVARALQRALRLEQQLDLLLGRLAGVLAC